jgi:hypothetical protein
MSAIVAKLTAKRRLDVCRPLEGVVVERDVPLSTPELKLKSKWGLSVKHCQTASLEQYIVHLHGAF